MSQDSQKRQAGTPLNTQDVTRVAGASRRVLDRYEQSGLLVPHRENSSLKAKKYWSVEQAKIADYVRILQHADMSIDDIADLSDEGFGPFFDTTCEQCAADIRNARRQMKAAIKDQRRCVQAQANGVREGLYLRSFPQRWLALAPIDDAGDVPPSPDDQASLFVELYSVAHVVGWAPTGGAGVLMSVDADGTGPISAFAYIELASPPMPVPHTGELLDGGCYKSIAADGDDSTGCDGDCTACTHFGRTPTADETFRWNAAAADGIGTASEPPMVGEMEPYAYGIWSKSPVHEDDPMSVTALRPRLMPLSVSLPLGIRACCLPEGAYLCTQCAEDVEATTYQRFIGTTFAIPRREFSAADEKAMYERVSGMLRPDADDTAAACESPFQPVFAQAGITDLATRGWVDGLGADDLHKLVLPVGMALPPQDGFCVTYSTLQVSGRNEPPRLELRLLVNAVGALPDGADPAYYDTMWAE